LFRLLEIESISV